MACRKIDRLRTLPLWAVWTLLCSPPAWARTPPICVWHFVDGLEFMGVKIDPEKNNIRGEERIISPDDAKVKVLVIPTNEELMIAKDTAELVG